MYLPTNSLIKLRRQLKTTCDLHASAREIAMYEDLNTKFYNINLSTPHQITADNFNNSLVRIKKKITFKSFDYVGIKLKK